MKITKSSLVYFFIFLLIFLPWFNSDSDQIDYIPQLSQESNPFYEINPCKISFMEFMNANKKSIFQDHYFFRANNKSSIKCFGMITGISVQQKNLQTEFYVSVGTNSLINLLLQGSVWILILSLIKKSRSKIWNFDFRHNIAVLFTSYLFAFSIYSQIRFYESSFYVLDFSENSTNFLMFLIFLLLNKNLIEQYLMRSSNAFNMIPFIFLLTGIFSGYNLVFFSSIFVYSGFQSLFEKKYNKRYLITYLSLSFWWLVNSNGSFYFKPGKFRGFTNSIYEFNSNLFWIVFFGLVILGILRELNLNIKYFNLSEFTKYFSYSSSLILVSGLIGSNFPSLNFFATYYFGLQRNVVELVNPFAFDQFGEKISWRGLSPSSETIGEFFGLCLIFCFFDILYKSRMNAYHYIGILFSSLGLYLSDNRTSILIMFLIIIFFFIKQLKPEIVSNIINKKKIVFGGIAIFSILTYIFLQSQTYDFYSNAILSNSQKYQYDSIFSSYLILLNKSFEEENFIHFIFGFFSSIGFLLNRSEMWGIFFARYNPTFLELLIGSGPLTLGQLYGEVKIADLDSFLLPHSSLLSFIVYFGLVIVLFMLFKYLKLMIKNKHNPIFLSIATFILLNVVKNDSLNYFPIFVFYFYLLFVFNKVVITNQRI